MSIVDTIVSKPRELEGWDALETTEKNYKSYYIHPQGPQPELTEESLPTKPGFTRYRLEHKLSCDIQKVGTDHYQFNCADAPGKWLDAMQNMVHDETNDILVGISADRAYIVTIGYDDSKSNGVECSFFLEKPPLLMIGHAHF